MINGSLIWIYGVANSTLCKFAPDSEGTGKLNGG
jgi:hypothetical protein